MQQGRLQPSARRQLYLRLLIRLALAGGLFLLFFFVVPPLLSLFAPFAFALLMAWLLNPLVRLLQKRWGGSRKLLAFFVMLLVFAFVGTILTGFLYTALTELRSLLNNWDSLQYQLQAAMDNLNEYLDALFRLLPKDLTANLMAGADSLTEWIWSSLAQLLAPAVSDMGGFAMRLPGIAIAWAAFIMACYFIIADYPDLHHQVNRHLNPRIHGWFSYLKKAFAIAFGGYIKAQLILSAGVLLILILGFLLIGQQYALLLAGLLAILDFIPIVGAGTVLVPWLIIDLLIGNVYHAIQLGVLFGIIALFRRFLEPKMVADQTGLSPLLSLASIYVGMRLAGVLGMILAPVFLLVCINVFKTGIFQPTIRDLRSFVRDIAALLQTSSTKRN